MATIRDDAGAARARKALATMKLDAGTRQELDDALREYDSVQSELGGEDAGTLPEEQRLRSGDFGAPAAAPIRSNPNLGASQVEAAPDDEPAMETVDTGAYPSMPIVRPRRPMSAPKPESFAENRVEQANQMAVHQNVMRHGEFPGLGPEGFEITDAISRLEPELALQATLGEHFSQDEMPAIPPEETPVADETPRDRSEREAKRYYQHSLKSASGDMRVYAPPFWVPGSESKGDMPRVEGGIEVSYEPSVKFVRSMLAASPRLRGFLGLDEAEVQHVEEDSRPYQVTADLVWKWARESAMQRGAPIVRGSVASENSDWDNFAVNARRAEKPFRQVLFAIDNGMLLGAARNLVGAINPELGRDYSADLSAMPTGARIPLELAGAAVPFSAPSRMFGAASRMVLPAGKSMRELSLGRGLAAAGAAGAMTGAADATVRAGLESAGQHSLEPLMDAPRAAMEAGALGAGLSALLHLPGYAASRMRLRESPGLPGAQARNLEANDMPLSVASWGGTIPHAVEESWREAIRSGRTKATLTEHATAAARNRVIEEVGRVTADRKRGYGLANLAYQATEEARQAKPMPSVLRALFRLIKGTYAEADGRPLLAGRSQLAQTSEAKAVLGGFVNGRVGGAPSPWAVTEEQARAAFGDKWVDEVLDRAAKQADFGAPIDSGLPPSNPLLPGGGAAMVRSAPAPMGPPTAAGVGPGDALRINLEPRPLTAADAYSLRSQLGENIRAKGIREDVGRAILHGGDDANGTGGIFADMNQWHGTGLPPVGGRNGLRYGDWIAAHGERIRGEERSKAALGLPRDFIGERRVGDLREVGRPETIDVDPVDARIAIHAAGKMTEMERALATFLAAEPQVAKEVNDALGAVMGATIRQGKERTAGIGIRGNIAAGVTEGGLRRRVDRILEGISEPPGKVAPPSKAVWDLVHAFQGYGALTGGAPSRYVDTAQEERDIRTLEKILDFWYKHGWGSNSKKKPRWEQPEQGASQ